MSESHNSLNNWFYDSLMSWTDEQFFPDGVYIACVVGLGRVKSSMIPAYQLFALVSRVFVHSWNLPMERCHLTRNKERDNNLVSRLQKGWWPGTLSFSHALLPRVILRRIGIFLTKLARAVLEIIISRIYILKDFTRAVIDGVISRAAGLEIGDMCRVWRQWRGRLAWLFGQQLLVTSLDVRTFYYYYYFFIFKGQLNLSCSVNKGRDDVFGRIWDFKHARSFSQKYSDSLLPLYRTRMLGIGISSWRSRLSANHRTEARDEQCMQKALIWLVIWRDYIFGQIVADLTRAAPEIEKRKGFKKKKKKLQECPESTS